MTHEDHIAKIKIYEGFRNRLYEDTLGFLTIGYGTKIEQFKHNKTMMALFNTGINKAQAEAMMMADFKEVIAYLVRNYNFYNNLSMERKFVMISMAYQLGVNFGNTFKCFIKALEAGNFKLAKMEMLYRKTSSSDRSMDNWSSWHLQTKARCEELSTMMYSATTRIGYNYKHTEISK